MVNVIGFPKLGLELTINRVAFTIFERPVYWYAICILSGYILGMLFVSLTCKKRGVSPESVTDICFWGLIFAIVGARLYYCIFDWDSVGGFLGIFRIWEGGLAIYGGLIGAVLTAYIYCHRRKLNFLQVFDVCAPGLFIGQILGRWGNFFNAEVYGGKTSTILGMTINGNGPFHPLFLYEGLWNTLGLILMLSFRDKKHAEGQVFCFYVAWYSLGRLFLEGMRQSEYILYLIPNVLGISQVVALFGIVLGLGGIIYLEKKK